VRLAATAEVLPLTALPPDMALHCMGCAAHPRSQSSIKTAFFNGLMPHGHGPSGAAPDLAQGTGTHNKANRFRHGLCVAYVRFTNPRFEKRCFTSPCSQSV
jgi:hypothetical protein